MFLLGCRCKGEDGPKGSVRAHTIITEIRQSLRKNILVDITNGGQEILNGYVRLIAFKCSGVFYGLKTGQSRDDLMEFSHSLHHRMEGEENKNNVVVELERI